MKPHLVLKFSLGLVLAALAVGLPATVQADTNVVPNPGFEVGPCGHVPGGPGSIICNWGVSGSLMSRSTDNPHSGQASLRLDCLVVVTWCRTVVSVRAETKAGRSCAPIGPGAHPGSLWYRTDAAWVALQAEFYETPNCEGGAYGLEFGDWAIADGSWHQLTGQLGAPAGTQSAFFFVRVYLECPGFCFPWANFDDVDVESGAVPRSGSGLVQNR
jgi:hypothetical protein